jgi:hypothetical protein
MGKCFDLGQLNALRDLQFFRTVPNAREFGI